MHQNILVTGGAGFVGSNLALAFKADRPSARVVSLDNLKRRGSELNLPRLKAAGVEFLHGDIRCPEDLEAAGPFDLMLECSAEPSVLAGYGGSPAYLLRTNLVGTLHCLEAVRKNRADLVFLSTSRVYPMKPLRALAFEEGPTRLILKAGQAVSGVSPAGLSEDFPLEGPRTLYGATKLASELVIAEYGEMYGVRAVVNRCGVLTGAWQMGKVDQGFMALWAAAHVFGRELAYIGFGGKGFQVRDVLHVRDLHELLRLQLADIPAHAGRVYNVGGGPEGSLSLHELTHMVRRACGKTVPIREVPETRPGDIPWYVTDNGRVSAATGWRPRTRPEAIVAELAAWLAAHQDLLKGIL